ncbi:MAG: hypothetical protein LBJ00_11730 [Planctomycetaceae bacterium]|nr:hypothetical protein [Planctomycetaceae bacterium]
MNNRFMLLRLLNALRFRFTAASGILERLEYNCFLRPVRDEMLVENMVKTYFVSRRDTM